MTFACCRLLSVCEPLAGQVLHLSSNLNSLALERRLYLERQLRESIGLDGTPIRIYFRTRKGSTPARGEVGVQRR
jgi:hypothetical protein